MVHNPPSRASKRQGQHMNIQEELETLRASESIKHANLQELARLVLAFKDSRGSQEFINTYNAMTDFAKGVAQ